MHGRYLIAILSLLSHASSQAVPKRDTELARLGQLDDVRLRDTSLLGRHEGHHDMLDDVEEAPASASHSAEAASASPTMSAASSHGQHEHHHGHGKPLTEYNETITLMTHAPDPLSYLEHDSGPEGHRGLFIGHIVLATLAFFVLLPVQLFLKAAGSPLSTIPQISFLVSATLSTLLGAIYASSSPNLYEGDSHSRLGWVLMFIVYALNALDLLRFFARVKSCYAGRKESSVADAWPEKEHDEARETLFVASPVEETDETDWSRPRTSTEDGRKSSLASSEGTAFEYDHLDEQPRRIRQAAPARSTISSLVNVVLLVVEYSTVVLAYTESLSGIAVYTGTCRGNYINGCMAHAIKGSIFLWYGLLTFARYVGAFSQLGWAWNCRPDNKRSIWTAEFVESTVIFVYGATNTWMERMGKGDSPYSVKDVQHISIATMFWFAGLLGMLLESQRVRDWLSYPARSTAESNRVTEPASYKFSFNPFPAFVIGVTGIAMSAHHQQYQFQVDIHALWGWLLGGFAALRFLTYFFLYLRPPASILPSRPPTEALAAFSLTAGGVVFILSVEQVSFAAMKSGWDDMMAFLNTTVALVSIWFVWIVCLFALKGWASKRSHSLAHFTAEHKMPA